LVANGYISYDRAAACYDATRALPPEAIEAATATLRSLTGTEARVLEVGAGTGRFSVGLAESGVRMKALDLSAEMLARLRAKSGEIPVVRGVADRLPFAGGKFDAVLFLHVLHLVPDVQDALREARRVVRSGGVVIAGQNRHERDASDDWEAVARAAARERFGIDGSSGRPRSQSGSLDEFREAMTGAGWALEGRQLAEWDERITAQDLLDRIRAQANSWTWSIPRAEIGSFVEAVTSEVERVAGGLARVLETKTALVACVARSPGS
jgi:SAM-dependent methyltransferase